MLPVFFFFGYDMILKFELWIDEMDSQRGGAAGEILVRRSLEGALADLGVAVTVARSDAAFDATDGCAFDYIIMDPWTWAGPGEYI
jgi:hypothetical protein